MLPRSPLTKVVAVLLCTAALGIGSAVAGQATLPPDADGGPPAHVALVEGAVSLEREGRFENAPLNMPLLSGDRLKTLEGRAEILFGDNSALQVDARSTLDIQSDELIRLIDGRLRLNILARHVTYRVDSPAGSIRITQPGEYRVALLRRQDETQLELAVVRGGAEIFTEEGTTPVRAGERAYASAGLAPSYPYAFNSANWDAFDRWSEARRDNRLGAGSAYLPEDIQAYASTFNEYGDWRYQQSYGYVWYPRVAASWRPYYYGRWAPYPRYGWTWIGADAFAWPTHHYGRWGFSAGAWFWIPSSRWAPAYVSWAYAPGYVSWSPLGFDDRPIVSVNVFGVGPGYYSSSHAWTSVSASHFGRDYYVHQRAVDWDRYDRTRRPRFELGAAAPAYRNVAVPRSSNDSTAAPIRWAGSRPAARQGTGADDRRYAPSSSATPRYINRGNEIVRSRTERPTAPAPSGDRGAGAPTGAEAYGGSREYRLPNTGVPARAVPRSYDPRTESPAYAPQRGYEPRRDYRQPIPEEQGRAVPRWPDPRTQSPASAPPAAGGRAVERRGDSPAYRPRSEPPPAPETARPRGETYNPRGADPRPASQPSSPAARERDRQPPPSAPAGPPAERAQPRSGGTAGSASMPVRRGRGGI